jgi:hypothetical protein
MWRSVPKLGRGDDMPDRVRIAAAGDVHCEPRHRDEALRAFAGLDAKADLLLSPET